MRTLRILQSACLACAAALAGCRTGTEGPAGFPSAVENAAARAIAIEAVEPRFQPALAALRAAVDSGDDREARAVLSSFFRLEPAGPALDAGLAYERILDGRAAVAALDLRLETVFERGAGGAGVAVVEFVARAREPRTFAVRPGPGVLHVRFGSIDARGDETHSLDTLPVQDRLDFAVSGDHETRRVLARLPFALPRGALAARATFDLDLRSGVLRVDERELPAMHLHTATGELVLLAQELSAQELSAAGDLAAHAALLKCDARTALGIAVRLPQSERAAALDGLARACDALPETSIAALTPALRWLAPGLNLGEDAPAWRAFLRARARALEAKPDLILPRARGTGGRGT